MLKVETFNTPIFYPYLLQLCLAEIKLSQALSAHLHRYHADANIPLP